jgi:integrase
VQNAAAFAASCCAEFGDLSTALQLARWAALRATAERWPDITFKRAMDEHLANNSLGEVTYRARVSIFKRIYNEATLFCENTYLHALTPEVCRELLAPYKKTPTTYNSYRRTFSSLLSWAADMGYMPKENPMLAVKLLPVQEAKITALQPEALATLLRATDSQPALQLYFAICAFAGIRPTEVTRLRWSDIAPDEPIISVRSRSSKTGGARHITIRPVLAAWIEHCKPASVAPTDPLCPVTAHTLQMARSTIPGWQADVLRHSFASYALKHGTSLEQLQLDMGHSNLAMLRARYLNLEGLTKEKAEIWWNLTPDSVLN